ncbi:hypothetical protein LXL04_028162 [Taraxacum kok-saghyz]
MGGKNENGGGGNQDFLTFEERQPWRESYNLLLHQLPEHWNEDKLWQEFHRTGTVVDVFVAHKRNRVGRKFGFVRFLKISDNAKKEVELNNLWFDKFKLKANVAKYGRKEERTAPEIQHKLKSVIVDQTNLCQGMPESSNGQSGGSEKTYAAAVNGWKSKVQVPTSPVTPYQEADMEKERNSIQVFPTSETVENLKKTLIGEVHNYSILKNLNELPSIEGLNDVKICYIGGLSISIEFSSIVASKNYLCLAKDSWKKWFRELKSWATEDLVMKRLVSLSIVGIPPHAWNSSTFSDIGAIWGEVVIHEWCKSENKNRDRGRIAILTQEFKTINDTVEISIERNRYTVLVMEDPA